MKIKEKVELVNNDSYVVGLASILIDDCFVVKGIKIVQMKKGGYLVAMPSRKNTEGGYNDIAHPINSETRELIEEKIMDAFYKEINNKLSVLAEELGTKYHFTFKSDDIHSIALLHEDNDLVNKYTLDSYKQEQLDELYEEIKKELGI